MSSSSSGSSSSESHAPPRKRKQKQAEVESSDSTGGAALDSAGPVLSHAQRRRQKKKQKLSESPSKKRKLSDGTAPSPIARTSTAKKTESASARATGDPPTQQQRQNSVWVGNMSFRTTQEALRQFFAGIGTVTRVHMPVRRGTQTTGENMGFAYVDFDTPEAKATAITLSEGQLDGRHLLIKDGDDFTGRPVKTKMDAGASNVDGDGEKAGRGLSKTAQRILRVQKQPPAPTLFLGNLGFETTEASIRDLFEAHRYRGQWGKRTGEQDGSDSKGDGKKRDGTETSGDVWIRKVRMGTFEDSGTCKGFAFVDFTSIEHATATLVDPRNHRLNGRDLVVEYASPDAVRRGGGSRQKKGVQDKQGSAKMPQKDAANAPSAKPRRPQRMERTDVVAEATTTSSRRLERAGHGRSPTRRAKPGAALAHAQRQSAAILPGQGQKIVF